MGMRGGVGNETKADTQGAGLSRDRNIVGESGLAHAVGRLKAEHPQRYDDLGPHHGVSGVNPHMPLGGMKPGGKC